MSAKRTSCKVVCACLGVTGAEVAAVVRSGRACSLGQVTRETGAGDGCTACHAAIRALLEHETGQPHPSTEGRRLTG